MIFICFESFKKSITNKHTLSINFDNLKKIHNLFLEWDNDIIYHKDYNVNFQWSQFLYSDNLPVTKPPWGEVISINIINGKINAAISAPQ